MGGYQNSHPGIKESIALVKEQEGNKQLIVYYVPNDPGHNNEPLDPQQLRNHLKIKLPGYMIPAGFMHLESIPLTPNGKVDRKKLQVQNVIFTRTKKALPPRSKTEKQVLTIWKDLLDREDIGIEDGFFDAGGDSILAVAVAEGIKKNLECDFNVTALFKYANVKEISKFITGTKSGKAITQEEPGKKPATHAAVHGEIPNIESHGKSHYPGYYQDSIAIIGISCHFPGAKNHDEFWTNLSEGKESIRFFSEKELQDLGIPTETIKNPNYIPVQSTIEGKELFDPGFFNISPRDAEFMDPQLRFLLLHSWQAIEDAGYNCKQIPQTSVYISAGNSFYQTLLPGGASQTTGIIEHSRHYVTRVFAQGGTIPTMISHHLGLKGPSFFVHTNCSSSLAGIHLACLGLKSGEAKYALVGAAAINSSSTPGYVHQPGLNFSGDGHIKAFDASADGIIGGEGAAVMVLKKAIDAIEDGDHIYALIRGISVNNDGADKVGFYAPSIKGQARVIQDTLNSTRIHPESIGYIETHGTGTRLGDPIEFAALAEVYKQYTEKKQYCGIGSVKTNIGHLDTAAGLAGCIKVALSLYHNEIPPSLNFKKTNPNIDMKNSPFYVVERLEKWEKNPEPHRAALSSFGIGGTNTHAILEQYIAAGTAAPVPPGTSHNNHLYIIPLSAKNDRLLKVYARKLLEFLKHPDINLEALAYTLQTGREAMEERVVFLAGDIPTLKTKLNAFVQGKETSDVCWRGKVTQDNDICRLFAGEKELNQTIETWISQGKLGKIVELWVQGFAMKWELLYGETRPQRISLPTYPFARERFWAQGLGVTHPGAGSDNSDNAVDSIDTPIKGKEKSKQNPSGPGAKEDVQLMTFAEDWQEQALSDTSPKKIKTLICFLSEPQNQQALVKTVKTLHHGTRVIFIAQHPAYQKHTRQKYGIPAAEGHAYREAFKSIWQDYGQVDAVLYLWPLEDPACIRDYCPIVYILQAMAPQKNPAAQRLNKSFDQTFSKVWPPAGPRLKPGKLLLTGEFENGADRSYLESWIGIQRSMGFVLPNTRAAVIIQDKTAGRQDRETAIENWTRLLWAELQTPESQGVLYRGGKRHVYRVRPTAIKPGKTLLKPGGTYLITGGCGGLGFLFARHLAETYQAKLVLTGRSPLDEKKKSQIKILEDSGGRVLYEQADVCDPHRMKQAVSRARERFGGIHGVIHAAGILDETGILEKDMRNFQKVLAPKIKGTFVLDDVLHENREPLDFTCYFSSSAAILGDFGSCDYAVGNRFQMAYAHCRARGQLQAQPRDKTVVINWPLWRDGGKGFKSEENSKIYLKSSGQRFLEAREGIEMFERLLTQGNTQHLVMKGQLRRVYGFLGLNREQNFGSITDIHGPAGKRIEKGKPAEMKGASLEQCLESDLKEHFCRLLKIPRNRLAIDKNLAELGFDSIGFVEFAALLNNQFKIEITPGIFFGEPTIGALTRYLIKEHEEALRQYYQKVAPGHISPVAWVSGQQASPKELEKPGGISGPGVESRYLELVRLNCVTQGRPVFWIHGGMGGVEVYQALAKKIQRPFYGIQARGWMTGRAPLKGIQAMAAYYFNIIESLQPEGPYDLGGYSLGGVLAYEVARHLQEVEQTVETIVLLEPPDSIHLRKINLSKKGDMLRAVNMALLMTIQQEPGKIARTLVHREELNVNVSKEVFLRQLITLAKSRGLTRTSTQLRAFIRQCAKVQGAYGYSNYFEQPLPDPLGVTSYYFLKTGEAFYGELKPYFTIRDDEMPLDHTDFWQGWRDLLPCLHMLEVEASNHLMLLTEPESYETISRFCQELYSKKGATPGF